MAGDPDLDASASWPHHIPSKNYPYSPSLASTASSSSSSVFSLDAPSSQSSVSSSVGWSSSAWNSENENENQYFASRHIAQQSTTGSSDEEVIITSNLPYRSRPQSCAEAVAPESRQHPRRTQRLNSYESQDGKTLSSCPRPPPSLVRQSERKENFVDSLVDTTTQMIETIWPLSVLSCGRDTILGGKQQNLIGLRVFVQEVLRRSKTSYSTLQVALYYLILIQSCIPRHDFTMEQSEDSPACRAMQCGRRMFLAALILASKYLQDRNFSARAWSKISGLQTCEINSNEMAFLSAVNWKLHLPQPVFDKWTDIVLKYSPSAQVNAPPRSFPTSPHNWKSIVPLLTPELDTLEFGSAEVSDESGYNSPVSDMSPPPIPLREELSPCSDSNEPTPTNPYTIPRVLEPTPRDSKTGEQILPPLPHLGPLPTPQMTPQTGTFCTPAVSASGLSSGRSSMSYAMAQIQNACMARSTLDYSHQWKPNAPAPFPMSARRSSLARSASTFSSPESTISDVSTRSSRSSSISSVASSNCALPPPRLAVQATRRCTNMKLCGVKEENQRSVLTEDDELSWEAFSTSRQGFHDYQPKFTPISTHHSASTREAAAALRDLALNRQHTPLPTPRPAKCLKRSYPNSVDSSVQSAVRDLIAPRCLGDITNMKKVRKNEEDGTVLPDGKVADSFLFSSHNDKRKPALSRDGLPRKRTCAGSDRGGREEARMMQKVVARGPGMWEEIL
ncbi:MAG: hypothetical protein ASARMPREDX12_006611 [Alectoria sarmentosa]|nr:MAG: hypothetical protein ASARMPREDX12_006611 [Alectoria sarmentosa]